MEATFVFDGECGFCRWSLLQLQQRLPVQPVPQAWQSIDLSTLGLSEAQTAQAAWWIDETGRYPGHEAFARWLRVNRAPWSCLGRLMTVPGVSTLCRWGYRAVARNRRRIPGPWEHSCGIVR
ncbi:DCC1-like thiol-disulfide oxidoreductase family protein [Kitasatospora sp. MAA4]|uniref:thiol-disulfide oxidoreductase DCC family protein n=1 Tax=Kitasatospora sp. MAA4 TaxID=3035093 RepID=UPI002476993E|nr:DCC1-like thiol-disulfide oxidoreductase family protein [Kitasatospora sp. MAA4]